MTRPLRILIAPSGFKESLSPIGTTTAMARGLQRVWPDAEFRLAPVPDGGEGFVETLVWLAGGTTRDVRVSGPLGEPVDARIGFCGDFGNRTALIGISSAAGLSLVPRDRRDPTRTSSRGVGQLMRAALDFGAQHLVIGCGDSGVHDAGMGLATELGVHFLDESGRQLGDGGGELARLAQIDLSALDRRLGGVTIEASVNAENVLLGARGVTRRHAAQKGATEQQVEALEHAFASFDRVVRSKLGIDIAQLPGSGASGGIGAALVAFTGATLVPRMEFIARFLDLDALLEGVDIVVTGEGMLDGQSTMGKVPCAIARIAAERGIPTIAVAGSLGQDVEWVREHGIVAYASILEQPCPLDDALRDAEALLERATERVARMLHVGVQLGERKRAADAVRWRRTAARRQAIIEAACL